MTPDEFSNNPVPQGFLITMAGRTASWGLTITGFLGWMLAVNAALSNRYIGAGVCLAFAAVRRFFLRKPRPRGAA